MQEPQKLDAGFGYFKPYIPQDPNPHIDLNTKRILDEQFGLICALTDVVAQRDINRPQTSKGIKIISGPNFGGSLILSGLSLLALSSATFAYERITGSQIDFAKNRVLSTASWLSFLMPLVSINGYGAYKWIKSRTSDQYQDEDMAVAEPDQPVFNSSHKYQNHLSGKITLHEKLKLWRLAVSLDAEINPEYLESLRPKSNVPQFAKYIPFAGVTAVTIASSALLTKLGFDPRLSKQQQEAYNNLRTLAQIAFPVLGVVALNVGRVAAKASGPQGDIYRAFKSYVSFNRSKSIPWGTQPLTSDINASSNSQPASPISPSPLDSGVPLRQHGR